MIKESADKVEGSIIRFLGPLLNTENTLISWSIRRVATRAIPMRRR